MAEQQQEGSYLKAVNRKSSILHDRRLTFAKGFLDDPAAIPAWDRSVEFYPEPLRPIVEMPAKASGLESTDNHVANPPESLDWWDREISWMKDRRRHGGISFGPGNPLAGLGMAPLPDRFESAGISGAFRLRPWEFDTVRAGAESFRQAGTRSRSTEVLVMEQTLPSDVATAADVPFPHFWLEVWAMQYFDRNASPRRVTNDGHFETYANMWHASWWAANAAYETKWLHCLARPEEVFARVRQPLNMQYPNGAPNCPSYPSATAMSVGAAAAVLYARAPEQSHATILGIAEKTAMGRWLAGVNWVCDIIAGLAAGWEWADAFLGTGNLAPSPWSTEKYWSN